MGTKAVFAISSKNPGRHYTRILGCTMDGSKENLIWLAQEFMSTAKKLQVLTQVRKFDLGAISKVQDHLASKHWFFVDDEKNAAWVSWSAVLNPKTNILNVYQGLHEDFVSQHKI